MKVFICKFAEDPMGEQAVVVKEEEPEDLSLRTREVRDQITNANNNNTQA